MQSIAINAATAACGLHPRSRVRRRNQIQITSAHNSGRIVGLLSPINPPSKPRSIQAHQVALSSAKCNTSHRSSANINAERLVDQIVPAEIAIAYGKKVQAQPEIFAMREPNVRRAMK